MKKIFAFLKGKKRHLGALMMLAMLLLKTYGKKYGIEVPDTAFDAILGLGGTTYVAGWGHRLLDGPHES